MGRTFPEAKRLCLPGAGTGMFEGGSAGASSSFYAHRQTHRDARKIHIHTHTLTHSQRHTPYSLLLGAGTFCLPQKGPVTGLNGPPAPQSMTVLGNSCLRLVWFLCWPPVLGRW